MKTLEEAAIDCAIEHTGIERGGFVESEVQIRAHELQDAFIEGFDFAKSRVTTIELMLSLNQLGITLPKVLINKIIDVYELVMEKGEHLTIEEIERLKLEWQSQRV